MELSRSEPACVRVASAPTGPLWLRVERAALRLTPFISPEESRAHAQLFHPQQRRPCADGLRGAGRRVVLDLSRRAAAHRRRDPERSRPQLTTPATRAFSGGTDVQTQRRSGEVSEGTPAQ